MRGEKPYTAVKKPLFRIRKNQFMMEGDHKIKTLLTCPKQKVKGVK